MQQVLNKHRAQPLLTALGQSRQSPHSPQVKAGPAVWAWFPRDHPASLPATGRLQTRTAEAAGSCEDASFLPQLEGLWGARPGEGNIVDP